MAMMRFNIHCEGLTLKNETCMFEGGASDLCAMLSMLVDKIYESAIKSYGIKGLDEFHILTQKTLTMVHDQIVSDYLKGGQDENRDMEK